VETGAISTASPAKQSGAWNRDEFIQFLGRTCGLLAKHGKDGAIHCVCMDWRHADELIAAGRAVYSELKNIAVWAKSNPGMGSLYRSQHELVFVFKSGMGRHTDNEQLWNGRFWRKADVNLHLLGGDC
jgi:hypothetical protein